MFDERDSQSSDYLWDRGGPVDPLVADLEAKLSPLRHRAPAPAWPDTVEGLPGPEQRGWGTGLRLAAGLGALLVGAALVWRLGTGAEGWTLTGFEGTPSVDGRAPATGARLAAGQRLSTDESSRLRLLLPRVGEVEIGPGSRVRLLADRRDAQSLELEQGSLLARTWAPPRLFSIDTPAGRAVDYGCAYALDVDRAGTTRLRVEMGWVALEIDGREALVPAGASLRAGRDQTIGTPVWLAAGHPFRDAVEALDGTVEPAARATALAAVLAAAGPRDGLTLWHLLANGSPAERPAIFERLAAIDPPPAGVEREALLAGDRGALRAWFSALGLGEVPGWS